MTCATSVGVGRSYALCSWFIAGRGGVAGGVVLRGRESDEVWDSQAIIAVYIPSGWNRSGDWKGRCCG